MERMSFLAICVMLHDHHLRSFWDGAACDCVGVPCSTVCLLPGASGSPIGRPRRLWSVRCSLPPAATKSSGCPIVYIFLQSCCNALNLVSFIDTLTWKTKINISFFQVIIEKLPQQMYMPGKICMFCIFSFPIAKGNCHTSENALLHTVFPV